MATITSCQGTFSDLEDGRIYGMELNTQILELDSQYFTNPSTITVSAYYRVGADADRVIYPGIFVVEETADGETWTIAYNSHSEESEIQFELMDGIATGNGDTIVTGDGTMIGMKRDISAVRISLYSGDHTLIDRQNIPVVITAKSLTTEQVFNLLTNNGEAKGIYKVDNQLYISFNYAKGGVLTLGGADNEGGTLSIVDENGEQTFLLNNAGIDSSGKFRNYKGKEWIEIRNSILTGGYGDEQHGLIDLSAQYRMANGKLEYHSVVEARNILYLKSKKATSVSLSGTNATFYGNIITWGTIHAEEIMNRKGDMRYVKSWSEGHGTVDRIAKYYSDKTAAFYLWLMSEERESLGLITIDNSDERKKKHIQDSTVDALSVINKIRHVEYDWKENDGHVENGYIAQQLSDVCPRMALHMEESDTWQFESSAILQYATKAIQELSAKVERLEKALKTAGISLEEEQIWL